MNKVKLLNVTVDNLIMDEAIEKLDQLINNGRYNYVVTPNVDHIVKLDSDEEFQKVYKNADLVLTDGMPLIWISRLKGNKIKEKISGSDFFPKVCELATNKKYTIFLLGAAEGIAEVAAENIRNKYEGIRIVGTYSPKYGFENDENEINNIIRIVNKANPDILAVGFGAPKQEKFIYKYKDQLKVPVSLAIGATIDFEAGNIRRAPRWMQNVGLEWFYRLCKEPKRMFKRYLIDDLKIISILFKSRSREK